MPSKQAGATGRWLGGSPLPPRASRVLHCAEITKLGPTVIIDISYQVLTFLESPLVLVARRCTRHILLNMDPKARVKPSVSNQAEDPQAIGKLTKRLSSRPMGMMAARDRMMPKSMMLLEEG